MTIYREKKEETMTIYKKKRIRYTKEKRSHQM